MNNNAYSDHLFPSAERLPQNLDLKLVKADLMDDFPSAWNDCFDLVHQRFIWASLPNPAQALEHLIKATKRGGWVQLVDVDLVSYPESQHQPHAFSTLRKLARALFADPTAAGKQAQWLKDSGLVNVDHTEFDIAAGSGHKDPELGLKGSKNIREVMEMFMQAYVRKLWANSFIIVNITDGYHHLLQNITEIDLAWRRTSGKTCRQRLRRRWRHAI